MAPKFWQKFKPDKWRQPAGRNGSVCGRIFKGAQAALWCRQARTNARPGMLNENQHHRPGQHGGFGRPKRKPARGVRPHVPGRWRWPGSSVVPAGPNQCPTWTAPPKSAPPPRAAWWICQAQTKAGPGRAASCPRVSGGSSGACSNHRVFALNNNSRTSSHMARPRAQKGKKPI